METVKNASPLSVLSRTVVNRNVKREDIDSLPLPRALKDECFANVATDRSDESYRRTSLQPCECLKFLEAVPNFHSWIPGCNEKVDRESPFLFELLRGLSTSAEWLELPDRETLKERCRTAKSVGERERMQACLNTLRFDASTGLGRVHEWIHRYLYYEDVHGWYYVVLTDENLSRYLEATSHVDLVALPYGCIFANKHSQRNWILAILAIKNDDESCFRREMEIFPWFQKICDASDFVTRIAYVSTPPYYNSEYLDTKYVFEPMIRHALYWMLLLIPQSCWQDYYYREESEFQNCVVLLDPLHQCIGDSVETWPEDCPHVYEFDGKILNVKKIDDVPPHRDKQSFVRWCAARGMNTLMNLNGNCRLRPPVFYESE